MNDLRPEQPSSLEGKDDETGSPIDWIRFEVVDELAPNVISVNVSHGACIYSEPSTSSICIRINLHRMQVAGDEGYTTPKRVVVCGMNPATKAVFDFSPPGRILIYPE